MLYYIILYIYLYIISIYSVRKPSSNGESSILLATIHAGATMNDIVAIVAQNSTGDGNMIQR